MKLSFHRPTSRILIAGTLCLVFLLGTVLGWANTHLLSADSRFEQFTEELFQKEVSGNMLNLHYSLAYPEKKGIQRPKATLGTISLPSSQLTNTSSAFLSNTSSEAEDFTSQTLKKLQTFKTSGLSESNRPTLDMLLLYYKTQADYQDYSILYEPLSPSLGIQAQLPVLLAEYAFYQKQDIADYLNLLVSVEPYFESILAFEQEKSQQGYFMSDTTLDRVLDQCRSFIKEPDSNYMLDIFAEKLKSFGKLPQKEQDILIQKHKQILLNKVIPAYQNLILGLQSLRGTGRPSQGLAHLNGGKKYYEYLLQSQTGSYTPVREMQKRLAGQIAADMNNAQKILKQNPSLLRKLNSHFDLPEMEPQDILTALCQKTGKDFPALPETDYTVRYVHRSMQEYLSPAFYLTPPLDTRTPYLITSSGYIEGWATYIESYGYQYASNYLDDNDGSDYVCLTWLNRSINLCIYSLLDIGIHYYGWSQDEAARLLKLFGITNTNAISEIYQYIVETPANYLKYCWGYLCFLDLKTEWQTVLGNNFNPKAFHQYLLEIGPVQFPVLQKYMQKHLQKLTVKENGHSAAVNSDTKRRCSYLHLLLFSVIIKKSLQFQQCFR